jgi:hypothetical protein
MPPSAQRARADNPARNVAFNTAERRAEDVSHDIAREIMRRLKAPRHRSSASSTATSGGIAITGL